MSNAFELPIFSDVPGEFVPQMVEQDSFLLNGNLINWKGSKQDVYSAPVFAGTDGPTRIRLGSFPLFDEKTTDLVLESALRAYDLGRGEWPTMKVKDRIARMHLFVKQMREKRKSRSQRAMATSKLMS